jgi:hypothetical protein
VHTPFLTLLLLAATVDPRLAEPLRLLAEVGAREETDGHVGTLFADLPEQLGLTLAGCRRMVASASARVARRALANRLAA